MTQENALSTKSGGNISKIVFGSLIFLGLIAFVAGLMGKHPERAWQAYLINFLLFSAIAQGALLFSVIMRITKARWSGALSGLAESFTAFFPVSFALFLFLFLGKAYLFPWQGEDLHGKEVWLNIPFLFSRDCIALLVLYGIGMVYAYHALQLRLASGPAAAGAPEGWLRQRLSLGQQRPEEETAKIHQRMGKLSVVYALAYAFVLSLIGYDLVMSMDPHWISTLFGAYHFVKAFYIGLGALIILAAVVYLRNGSDSGLTPNHFHDIGKLFFAFCMLWGDFFYVQLVVIWYGNIPEETAYVIERTMLLPWKPLAWGVFIVCFVLPFLILINKKIKTKPRLMIIICAVVIVGIWLEHLLLVGPALSHHASTLPLGIMDLFITLGFFGLMAMTISTFIDQFPELLTQKAGEVTP